MRKKTPPKLIGLDGKPLGGPLDPPKKGAAPKGPEMPEAYLEPVKDPKALPIPLLWRVIVQPVTIPHTTAGGIMIPEALRDRMEYLRAFGRVVAIGPLAWTDETKFGVEIAKAAKAGKYPVEIGTWVLFDQYKGQIVEINGQKFKRMNDDDIDAIVPKPAAIQLKF